ncbi:uncharacterized protein (DUF2267 family) [Mesorhizobium soli]|uniref:DUF2267 domain-containing protein n=1 Tax=Pseudaminobacter soli (ex Li et al. 2025) TaxID=1295366 RepID=UPI0024732F0A|nr:DUF2267 domain-containing protein [Mesorhizobium soli]MDH6231859.1 uncharacterized protein (DUF2267 family) [Mesorhizobium soli]
MTGHPTFDHTVQEGNIWLKAAAEKLHLEDRRHAYSALRATLHALRDRLTPEMAVHFGAQLPMIIRGLYFEGWRMAEKPSPEHTVDEFCEHVARQLPPKFPREADIMVRGIFEVIFEQVDPGEVAKIIDQMPVPLKNLWPLIARRG